MSSEDLRELVIAITGLITATTALVVAIARIHWRVDNLSDVVENHVHNVESSSPKVLLPDKPSE